MTFHIRRHLLPAALAAFTLATSAAAASPNDAPSVVMGSNGLSLITEPQAGVAPLITAIEHARTRIDLVMYENEDPSVDSALVAARKRGVAVKVLLNGGYYGEGFPENEPAYKYFQSHGVQVRWTPKYFALTHQKTLLVDNTAYILTFNLTPQYYSSSRDFGVVDTNRADVNAVAAAFADDWNGDKVAAPSGQDLVWSPGSQAAQVNLINQAKGSLDIYNEEMDSYNIVDALAAAARRGVNVEVTMTYDSEWKSNFQKLRAAGVHVRTYSESASLYIHAKMILTPSRAFVGSENFSWTSMNRNRELGLIITDPTILSSLRQTFNADYAGARPYSG